MIYFKSLIDKKEIMEMIEMGNFGFCEYITKLLGKEEKDYYFYEDEQIKESLESYLNEVTGKKLYKDEQKELIKKVDLRVDGRQIKSYRKLNEGLEMIHLPFVINPKKSNEKRYWVVERIKNRDKNVV